MSADPQVGEFHYIVLTEPGRENTARASLINRGVDFYLPTIWRAGRFPVRMTGVDLVRPDVPIPLFPGYMFIAESVIQRSLALLKTAPGIRSHPFMTIGGIPARMGPGAIEAVKYIEATERESYLARKRKRDAPAWRPRLGQAVNILADKALGAMKGKVSAIDDRGRITILAELMKRMVPVKVTADQIEPA